MYSNNKINFGLGNFLSLYDCKIGAPLTSPANKNYIFQDNDYFVVVREGFRIPHGNTYTELVSVPQNEKLKVNEVLILHKGEWVSLGSP